MKTLESPQRSPRYPLIVCAISLLSTGSVFAQSSAAPMSPADRTSPTTDPSDRTDPSYPIAHSATGSGDADTGMMKSGAMGGKAMSATDSSSTGKFARKAALSGMMEVSLSKAAEQKSSNTDVKKLAAKMVSDHEMANKELKSIAQAKGIMLPTAVDAKDQAKADDITKLSGADFDKAYIAQLQKDHEKAVALFEEASKDTSIDPQVMAFAKKTLPTLQMHLTHVKAEQAKLGA